MALKIKSDNKNNGNDGNYMDNGAVNGRNSETINAMTMILIKNWQ